MKLTEVAMKESCIITKLNLDERAKLRLQHVGVYEGVQLKVERKGRKGKPLTLFVCGNFLMMRYADCENIEVSV